MAKGRTECHQARTQRDAAGLWETLPTSSAKPDVADRFEQIVHQNPLALLSGLERRKKASRSDIDNTQRATMERQDRERYAVLLAGFIREADLPVVKHLSGVMDADVWLKVFGRRRSRTLRNRYKDWTNFRRWLEVTHGRAWPAGIADLIDYSKERLSEGCGKTVLDAFQASLAVLEQVGRVSEPDMLSRDPTWISYLAATTADLKAAAPPARQAPMITVATIVALELYVISSDEPAYLRGIAWIALLMVYCSLRTDAVQGILPNSCVLSNLGFKAVLGRTKTTGADRRNHLVPIFIERSISLAGVEWLEVGFTLWKGWATERDFMVPRRAGDWSGPTSHHIKAGVLGGYVREVYKRLYTPKYEEGTYRSNRLRMLMTEDAHAFFTGHSPRNWMTSVAAAIKIGADRRDFLGRWLIGGAGSAEYTRTARQIIHDIQITVCKSIACGVGETFDEAEALQELKIFVDQRGKSGGLARRRHDILKSYKGKVCLGLSWPTLALKPEPDRQDDGLDFQVLPAKPARYFISISRKTGRRRLHLNGPCHVKPNQCRQVEYLDEVHLDLLDSICRDCKHRLRRDHGVEDKGDSSSESGSSSDSKSSDEQRQVSPRFR